MTEGKGGMTCNRSIATFFTLFCLVYYLESISGTYIISVVQSIEKQFRIPSKMSGTLISAQDVGYVPTVVLLAYLGSRGNRARWIGGGCILIALANLIISTPNFIFPEEATVLNETSIAEILAVPSTVMNDQASLSHMLEYSYYRNQISNVTYHNLTTLYGLTQLSTLRPDRHSTFGNESLELFLRGVLNNQELIHDKSFIEEDIRLYLRAGLSSDEEAYIMKSAAGPIGFCDSTINKMKNLIAFAKKEQGASNMYAFSIVFGALICLGIGHSMPWSLGVPLIDDNVKRKSLPTYFALMFFIKILGPISGFFIGGTCNRLYYTLADAGGLQPEDPRWIGAWWLGFLIIAGILIGPSVALFCFPTSASKNVENFGKGDGEEADGDSASPTATNSRTPKAAKGGTINLVDKHRHTRKAHESNVDHDGSMMSKLGKEFKTFGAAIATVMACPVYLFSLLGRIFDAFAFKGFYAFLPKYLDNHYGIPQYKANYFLGSFGVIGFAVGMLCGSVFMRKFKLEGRRAALFICICTGISASLSVSKVFLGCESVVNSVGKIGRSNDFNFTSTCNLACECDSVKLLPVCSDSGQVYYSPCHAGCTQMLDNGPKTDKLFLDCRCADVGSVVSRERCSDDCGPMILAYFIVAAASSLVGGFGVVPGVLIVLRSVPAEWRSVSIGFSGFVVSIGTMLSPPMFGYVIDTACLHWSGSCLIYDPTKLRNRVHLLYGALRAAGWIFDLFVLYHAKGLKIMSDDDPVDEDKDNQVTEELMEATNGQVDILGSNEDMSKKLSF